jgi:hypothetical protein
MVAVRREQVSRYHLNLSAHKEFRVQIVSAVQDVLDALSDPDQHIEVLVLDNGLDSVYGLVDDVRHSYPRLFIVLVDEEADFATPGMADEVTTEPFKDGDLIRRITKLMSDRQLETLRADSLPAVRQFAKELRNAPGELGKQQMTVTACKVLGYDYVAFYRLDNDQSVSMSLRAQAGNPSVQAIVPKAASAKDIMSWVAHHLQSRIVGAQDSPNHPLVAKGRYGTAACVPVAFSGNRFGVICAFREKPGSISQDNVMQLELMAAQLAAAMAKEIVG